MLIIFSLKTLFFYYISYPLFHILLLCYVLHYLRYETYIYHYVYNHGNSSYSNMDQQTFDYIFISLLKLSIDS